MELISQVGLVSNDVEHSFRTSVNYVGNEVLSRKLNVPVQCSHNHKPRQEVEVNSPATIIKGQLALFLGIFST